MAIDTRNKRGSCIGYAGLFNRAHIWPNPDGSIASQADRQHNAYVYPGILASALVVVADYGGSMMALMGVGR